MTKKRTVATRRKTTRTAARPRRKKSTGKMVNFFVPLFLMACILFCLGLLFSAGYSNAASSEFFTVRHVETEGARRVSEKKIEQIVRAGTYKSGVWNADLDAIKKEIETLKFVKHASVARVLPDTVRVTVTERTPSATARIGGEDFLVDEDARVLSKVTPEVRGPLPPFVLLGWDEDATQSAREMNRRRVALYLKLVNEWRRFDLVARVKAVDISDVNDPQAKVLDSGETVTISLGKEDFAKGLQKGLETIAGKGARIKYVIDPNDDNPIIGYRNS
jgi:cell division septal protein FtsQ